MLEVREGDVTLLGQRLHVFVPPHEAFTWVFDHPWYLSVVTESGDSSSEVVEHVRRSDLLCVLAVG